MILEKNATMEMKDVQLGFKLALRILHNPLDTRNIIHYHVQESF